MSTLRHRFTSIGIPILAVCLVVVAVVSISARERPAPASLAVPGDSVTITSTSHVAAASSTEAMTQAPDAATAPADEATADTPHPTEPIPGLIDIPSQDGTYTLRLLPGETPSIEFAYDDPEAVDAYYAANDRRITRLLADPEWQGQTIEVTLTFNHPVEWSTFTALRDAVGLEPIQYTFAERNAAGEKWALDVIAELDGERRSDEFLWEYAMGEAEFADVELLGIMLVQARITVAEETLGTLADDERVFAVDTVEAEATELMAERGLDLSVHAAGSIVRVWIPSFYWDYDWSVVYEGETAVAVE